MSLVAYGSSGESDNDEEDTVIENKNVTNITSHKLEVTIPVVEKHNDKPEGKLKIVFVFA